MSEQYVAPATRKAMQGNRSKDTKPELKLRSILHRRGLRYRVNHRPLAGIRMSADVVFTRAKVAVFVDGCFWHGCPDHYRPPAINQDYWRPKLERNLARDGIADAALLADGWVVIRAWEHQDPEVVADRVESAVGLLDQPNEWPFEPSVPVKDLEEATLQAVVPAGAGNEHGPEIAVSTDKGAALE